MVRKVVFLMVVLIFGIGVLGLTYTLNRTNQVENKRTDLDSLIQCTSDFDQKVELYKEEQSYEGINGQIYDLIPGKPHYNNDLTWSFTFGG